MPVQLNIAPYQQIFQYQHPTPIVHNHYHNIQIMPPYQSYTNNLPPSSYQNICQASPLNQSISPINDSDPFAVSAYYFNQTNLNFHVIEDVSYLLETEESETEESESNNNLPPPSYDDQITIQANMHDNNPSSSSSHENISLIQDNLPTSQANDQAPKPSVKKSLPSNNRSKL